MRYISAATASKTIMLGGGDNVAEEFGDVIATEIVLRNLETLLEKIQFNVLNDTNELARSEEFIKFERELRDSIKGINQLQDKNLEKGLSVADLVDRISKYEGIVLNSIAPEIVRSAQFGN